MDTGGAWVRVAKFSFARYASSPTVRRGILETIGELYYSAVKIIVMCYFA